jgi:hypothetical protein
MSVQLHAPAALPPGKYLLSIHCIEDYSVF